MNINFLRLYQQQLTQHRFHSVGEVVAWLGAVQAQDYAGAKWALGLRLARSNAADIEQAIASKAIVRSWLMRGTLQFVAAADIHWMLGLVAARIIAGAARRHQQLELDARTLNRSNTLIATALRDGNSLDRKQLIALLQREGISTQGQRAPHLLQYATLCRLVTQVGARSNQPIYMLFDDALPPSPALSRDEALAKLALTYFNSRGPATLKDYTWWSGLAAADARAGLAMAQSKLARDTYAGQEYWLSPIPIRRVKPRSDAHLLPPFDEYLIAYQDRGTALPSENAWMIQLGNGLRPTIELNGMIVGTWKRTINKAGLTVSTSFFRKLSAQEDQIVAEAMTRYAAFMGLPLTG